MEMKKEKGKDDPSNYAFDMTAGIGAAEENTTILHAGSDKKAARYLHDTWVKKVMEEMRALHK
eukprot:191856-Amorphochlora_amoeboformis.AAC.1